MDTFTQLSVPKYRHIKNTFEIFDARVKVLESKVNVNIKYLTLMKNIRTRVQNLLKFHKLYNELEFITKQKSDPINGDIPDETLNSLMELSKPRLKDLKEALIMVNRMIRTITSDYYYKESSYKMKRLNELMEYRKNICCLLGNTKFPSDPHLCYRFAPCAKKIINIWEIPIEGKQNSRMLQFDFDDTSKKLARPPCRFLRNAIEIFVQLKYNIIKELNENKMMTEREKEKREIAIKNIDNTLIRLQDLENLFKTKCKHSDIQPITRNKKKISEKNSTRSLQLPTRRRLEETLNFYKIYVDKFQRRLENQNRNKSEEEENEETKHRIKPLIQRIEGNIVCTQELLKILQPDEPHRQLKDKKKILYLSYDKSGRIIKYNFDEETNRIASPKLGILETAIQVQQNLLNTFENDLKNIEKVTKNREQKQNNSNQEQEEILGNEKDEDKTDIEYGKLKERINRLHKLIQQRKEYFEYLQNTPSQPGSPTTYFHHKLCFAKDTRKVISPRYKALKPHLAISTSEASEKYLNSSLNTYSKWIEEKKNDIKYRDEIEYILNNQNTSESLPYTDEAQEEEKKSSLKTKFFNEKISPHTQRMIQNKLKLETYLESIKSINDNDIHLQTHAKFEKVSEHIIKSKMMSGVNIDRINELAAPKRTLLKFSIIRFRHLMSEIKRKRLECKLSKELSRPEHIERVLRQKEKDKMTKAYNKSKTTERAAIHQLFKKITNPNILTEEKLITFEDLIRYSILNALQN